MKERPILFSGPMVRAILEGRKTMTRRVFKLNPLDSIPSAILPDGSGKGFIAWWGPEDRPGQFKDMTAKYYPGEDGIKCPYGQPGDRLWVRETWAAGYEFDHLAPRDIPETSRIEYGAGPKFFDYHNKGRNRPSIHMPRWASRINLEITGVKVERLQDISEGDAKAEGVKCNCIANPCDGSCGGDTWEHYLNDLEDFPAFSAVESFESLWGLINGERPGCNWDHNPYVWVVEFRRQAV